MLPPLGHHCLDDNHDNDNDNHDDQPNPPTSICVGSVPFTFNLNLANDVVASTRQPLIDAKCCDATSHPGQNWSLPPFLPNIFSHKVFILQKYSSTCQLIDGKRSDAIPQNWLEPLPSSHFGRFLPRRGVSGVPAWEEGDARATWR